MKHLLNNKVDIIRPALTDDSMGGETAVDSTLHHNLPCRINVARGTERRAFGKESKFRSHIMRCRIVDIVESDVVVDGSLRYEILDVSTAPQPGQFLTISLSLVR